MMTNQRMIAGALSSIKWGFLIGISFVIIKTLMSLGMTGIQKFIIDDVFFAGKFELLWYYLFIFLALVFLFNLFHMIGEITLNNQYRKANEWLLLNYMKKISQMPFKEFKKGSTGFYTNYYYQEINTISGIFASYGVLPVLIQKIVSFLALSLIVGLASPIIWLGILIIGVVFVPLGKLFAPKIKDVSKQLQQERALFNSCLIESISTTREVIAFNRLKWEENRLTALFKQLFRRSMDEVKLGNKQILIGDSLRFGTLFLVLSYGGFEVINQSLSVGLFVIIFQFSNQLMTSVNELYASIMRWPSIISCVERLNEVWKKETETSGGLYLTRPVKQIRYSKVSFRYEDHLPNAVENASLEVGEKSKVALVGYSGSGKSTIAQLLLGFYKPNNGEIWIDENPLHDINQNDWINRVAIVFQEPYIFPDSIRYNLTLGKDIANEELVTICQLACIHDDIMALPDRYETIVGERGITLSGGQRQRIALARALLRKPEVLVLDEATSALDLETERQVMRNLEQFNKKMTIMIIAHRLSTIMNADRIYVMKDGKIVGKGTHNELLSNNLTYMELVSSVE